MRHLFWSIAIAGCLTASVRADCAAQGGPRGQVSPLEEGGVPSTIPPHRPGEISALSGVYTEAQAARGDSLFTATCASCHAPPNEPIALERVWSDQPVSALFRYSKLNTPRDNPGSLTPQQYADIISYIFWLNYLPPGKEELPPNDSILANIRIEVKPPVQTSSTSTGPR